VSGFRITGASGREAEAYFRSGICQRSMGLGLRRATLDRLLMQKAVEHGAVTRLGCRIEKILKTGQGWQIETLDESWQTKFLIGADGRNSWVARQLGLTRSAAVQGRTVGFQVRLCCPGAIGGQIA